jgi:hypothetical protein
MMRCVGPRFSQFRNVRELLLHLLGLRDGLAVCFFRLAHIANRLKPSAEVHQIGDVLSTKTLACRLCVNMFLP